MNAQCYRVIFNKARGMLMVVSEAARSQSKTSNASEGGSAISQVAGRSQTSLSSSHKSGYQGGRLIVLRSQVLLALGLATIVATSSYADSTTIVADRNAAANNQAVIINTSSGKTQVNIQSPSAAGVSRNVFSQFDVGADGAILNNSRVNAQTQLAGWVEGNPYLARGEARVILNEVNSSDPSRLSGFTEIAGGRAELIIANPAGITCSGCGFINAARTTLTTGEALIDQGRVTGFDISKGNIRVDGDGLDTSTSDFTQILAKTTQINAAVYAKNLDVINGVNTVSYETAAADTVITPNMLNNSTSNQATGVALDVSALGAMYAGKIRLIGTEKGMGVTNAGSIIASNVGGLQLDNSGNLINTGSLIANKGRVDIDTRGNAIDNSGTIASSQSTATLASSTLNNSGVINSYNMASLQQTGAINNSGEISAGSFTVSGSSLNNTGKLLQTGTGQLEVATKALINSQGGIIGQDLYADASTPPVVVPNKKPPTTAANGSTVEDSVTGSSEPNPMPLPVITQNGTINVGKVTNTGSIYSNGKIKVTADSVTNQDKSSLAVNRLDIANNGSLANTDSRVQLENIDWQLANFDNSNSQITATNTISITSANQINNTKGAIEAIGDIKLTAQNQLNNNNGSILSNGTITTQSATLDNTQGNISSKGDIALNAKGNLTNSKGRIQSDKNLAIKAQGYSNVDGTIIGVQRAGISVTDDITINSNNNNIQAATLALTSQGSFSNTSKLSAQNALTITANNIDNTLGSELISNGTTELKATTNINNRGLINGSNTHLNAGSTVNNYSGGRIYGDQVAIAATTLNNTPDNANPAPVIAARKRLDIGVATLNNNPNQARAGKFNEDFNGQARLLSNGELHIGGSLDANHQAIGRATTVTNKGASIESVGDMSISTNTLNNVNADFKKETVLASSDRVIEYAPANQTTRYDKDDIEIYVHGWNGDWEKTLRTADGDYNNYEKFEHDAKLYEDKTLSSDASLIRAGGNISINSNTAVNDHSLVVDGLTLTLKDDPTQTSRFGFQNISTEGNTVQKNVNGMYYSYRTKDKTRPDNPFSDRPYTYQNGPYKVADESKVINAYQLSILKQDIDKVVIAHNVTDANGTAVTATPTDEIRSSGTAPTLPNNGLFGTNPDSDADYLIETDPAFANYKNWLSSSYMLERLKLDPTITQKRLGDGYYEQQYIRDQIMMLTGRYYLANYADQDTQYKGLMDAGITAAQTLNLRPGIALSAAQVAALTTDIVWLVEQSITLADGSTQQVLAPKVYTRQAAGQIDGTGNLIAANTIDVNLTGDLNNQSNIIGHQSVNITANTITNANGGVIKGSFVQLGTTSDLNNLSGTIAADSAMQLDIGGDLNNKSLTYNSESTDGASSATRTGITQIASIYVGDTLKGKTDANGNPLTTLVANVGGDTTFAAGRLDNQGGSSIINTKGDVTLDAVTIGYQSNSIGDTNNYYNQGASADIGSQITSNNDIIIKGNTISGTAASIGSTQGNIGIIAQGNVDFKEGRSKENLSTAVKTVDKGTFSTTKTQDRLDAQSDQSITSNIEGNTVSIQAGQDIGLRGTNVASNFGTQLTAGGDIDILAAQNTASKTRSSQEKKSGLFGAQSGLGFTLGKQQTDERSSSTELTHTASQVGAIDGNVIITASGKYQQTGSNIIAGMGADTDKDISPTDRGNTVIRAKQINIDSVTDIETIQSEQKFKQTGLSVAISNSLVDSVQSIDRLVEAEGNTDSTRMKGMAAVAGALKVKALAKQTSDALQGASGFGSTRIQATIGSQKSQSNSASSTGINQASNIITNNLALIATGAGTDSNITINGSTLNINNDALFKADNNFNINGVAQTGSTRSDNSSSSAAIGGYASFGGQGPSGGITASANKGKGYANSDSTTYANSQINVGGTSTFDIGNDVNIKGGVINTGSAQGKIGGNVNIESLQDTATYDSNQKNAGFTLDVDLVNNGAGSSLSVNGGKTDINADYKAVGQQSGIFTGDGGFDLEVGGKTTLIGGAITTTDKAVAAGRNKYVSRGGITTQDIENTSSYEGDAISVGLSVGNTTGKPQATMNGLGYGTDSDSNSSITKAGITGIAGNSSITTDNRAEYAGALENVFDAERVNEELGAQTQITQEFGKEAPKAVADFSESRIQAIRADTTLSIDEKLAAIKKWDEGGVYRVAAHTALGALGTGSLEGALTTGGVAAAAPTLDNLQKKISDALVANGMSEDIAKGAANGVISLALLGAGAAAGLENSSTFNATNVDANNRQLHSSEINALKAQAKLLGKGDKDAEQKWLVLLYGAAYARVDAEGKKKWNQSKQYIYDGIQASSQLGTGLGNAYLANFDKAQSIVNEMANNTKGNVYLKDNQGNRINDNKGKPVEFLNASSKQYNDSTIFAGVIPHTQGSWGPSRGPGSQSHTNPNDLKDALERLGKGSGAATANVGSGAATQVYPEDLVILGKGATTSAIRLAKDKAAKAAAAKATQSKLAKTWADKIDNVTAPHPRHNLTQVNKKKGRVKNQNSVVNDNIVNVAQDVKDIKNGLGTPISSQQIKVNGRTYETHSGTDNQLIPIRSDKPNEIFSMTRGEYTNLKTIMQNNGDVNKTRSYIGNNKDFNESDFKEAVRIYNLTK